MRETVADFYASRYARCLAALERWRPALQLDAGLARHMPALTAAIRERALLQYATPFSSVDLAAMAAAFNTSIGCARRDCGSSRHVKLWSLVRLLVVRSAFAPCSL